MFKYLHYLFVALVVTFSGVALTSCKDDPGKDESGSKSDDIVGIWKLTHEKGWSKEDGKIVEKWDEDVDYDQIIIFRENGDFIFDSDDNYPEETEYGTWSISSNKLILFFEEGYYDYFDIVSLTSKRMVLSLYKDHSDGDVTYYEATYTKQ